MCWVHTTRGVCVSIGRGATPAPAGVDESQPRSAWREEPSCGAVSLGPASLRH